MLKIAIIRLSAMGDIIHSISVLPHLLNELKKQHNKIEITWYVDDIFGDILEDSYVIDRLIRLPLKQSVKNRSIKQIISIYNTLKVEKYDYVIDFQGLLKSAIIGKLINSKCYVGFDSNSIKEKTASFFYNKKINIKYSEHILLRNAKLAFEAFDLTPPNLDSLLHPKQSIGFKKHNFNIDEKLKILIVLETSKPNKTYSEELFMKLVDIFNQNKIKPILLSYSKIIKKSNSYYNIHAPKLELVKSLVSQTNLVIGGDTGIVHLAWALKIPSITLFGATPSSRFSLATKQNLYIQANSKANYDKNDFSINTISPKEIFELSQTIIQGIK